MLNPQDAIAAIAKWAVCENPNRPWPNHRMPVVSQLTRHTPLMAVVWAQVSAQILDNDLNKAGQTMRTSFTLTPISQSRQNVTRMAAYLVEAVPYNEPYTIQVTKDNRYVVDNEEMFLAEYRQDWPNHEYPALPENQQLAWLSDATGEPSPRTAYWQKSALRVYDCRCEGWQMDYNPTQDYWQGQVTYIANMGEYDGHGNRQL